jgi:chemotaxis protein MotB
MWSRMLVMGGLVSLLAGCGVDQKKYDAAVAELNSCKDEKQATTDKLTKQNQECNTKLADMTSVARSLGAKTEQLATEKSDLNARLEEVERQHQLERARAAVYQGLLDKLKGMIGAGQLQVDIRNGKMVVKLPDSVLFDPGKTQIKPQGKKALEQLTEVLKAIPDRSFQVCGHTDNAPIKTGRFRSNWDLSTARAVEVVNFMIKSGMEPNRLSATGYGEYDPVAANDTAVGKAQNRRIEIVIMPNLEELPKIKEEMPKSASAR